MKAKSQSEVAQLCLTLSNPMDCSPPGSSVHGIFQARVLEWGAISFSDMCSNSCISLQLLIIFILYQVGLNEESAFPWLCADQFFREKFIKGLREIKVEKFDKHISFSGELLSYVN